MTLHAAKGLEFPVVFILGVEQGLIPHERAVREGDPREFEEERRLLFVGMTRARERLYLTQTTQRNFRGRSLHTIPSDFLAELEYTPVREDDARPTAPAWSALPESRSGAEPRRPLDSGSKLKLTTAADLLNGTRTAASLPQGFALGMQVRHPRYGLGTVVDVGGFGARRTVTVTFADGARRQTFMASKSPLQPVGA
jgi:DNA helicase-2/ATP-dependent DNA helicase PcrA